MDGNDDEDGLPVAHSYPGSRYIYFSFLFAENSIGADPCGAAIMQRVIGCVDACWS